MLLIDPRAGSQKLLQDRSHGTFLTNTMTRACPVTMRAGDVALLGNGPDDTYVTIGIEYKTLGDLLKCMCDGRLSGTQLPLLKLDFQQYWLLAEGTWRGNSDTGLLEQMWWNPYSHRYEWVLSRVGNRTFTALEFNSWLSTLINAGGMRYYNTFDLQSTIQYLEATHHWWMDKEFEEHRSHLRPDISGEPTRLLRTPQSQQERSRLLAERMAAQIEGIGWEKGLNASRYFKTAQMMVMAGVEDWLQVDGIGKTLANRAVRDITGMEVNGK